MSENLIKELTASIDQESPLDASIIQGYIVSVETNTSDIISNGQINENGIQILLKSTEALESANYSTIDPAGLVTELLEKILLRLHIDVTLGLFTADFISKGIKADSKVTAVIMTILTHFCNTEAVSTLMEDQSILHLILEMYLNPSTSIENVSKFENFFKYAILVNSKFVSYYCSDGPINMLKKALESSISKARFLDFLVIMIPYVTENGSPLEDLYMLNISSCFSEECDTLETVLHIQFYQKLISTLPEKEVKTKIFRSIELDILFLTELFCKRNDLSYEYDMLTTDLVHLISTVSLSNNHEIKSFAEQLVQKYQLFRSSNFTFDEPTDIMFLESFNLELVKNEDLESIVSSKPLFTGPFFGILLNFISRKKSFGFVKPYCTSVALSHLQSDLLFIFLLHMTKYDHSVQFLVKDLPTLFSNNLLNDNPSITNPEIFTLKKNALYNLSQRHDLGIWQPRVIAKYKELTFGKRAGDFDARVEIMDKLL